MLWKPDLITAEKWILLWTAFPSLPQGDDDEVLCLPLHEIRCKAEVQIDDRGITVTIFHRGESVSWADALGCVISRQMEIPTPDAALVTVKPVLNTPCVLQVLQGHPERLINARWQPRLCPPPSHAAVLHRSSDALPNGALLWSSRAESENTSFAARSLNK